MRRTAADPNPPVRSWKAAVRVAPLHTDYRPFAWRCPGFAHDGQLRGYACHWRAGSRGRPPAKCGHTRNGEIIAPSDRSPTYCGHWNPPPDRSLTAFALAPCITAGGVSPSNQIALIHSRRKFPTSGNARNWETGGIKMHPSRPFFGVINELCGISAFVILRHHCCPKQLMTLGHPKV